jgi:hypothetical protein
MAIQQFNLSTKLRANSAGGRNRVGHWRVGWSRAWLQDRAEQGDVTMKHALTAIVVAVVVAGGAAVPATAQTEGRTDPYAQDPSATAPPQIIWRKAEGPWTSDHLIGAEIVNDRDEALGAIDQLLITLIPNPASEQDLDESVTGGDEAGAPATDRASGLDGPTAGREDAPEQPLPGDASDVPDEMMAGDETAGGEEPTASLDDPSSAGETVMTPSNGSVRAEVGDVVVSIGGFLGIGGKRVSVPMERLMFFSGDRGEHKIVLDATSEELDAMPNYVEVDGDLTAGAPAGGPVIPR